MNTPSVTGVVLAGGAPQGDLAEAAGVAHRALVPIEGETMLARVVRALQESEWVEPLYVVSSVEPPAGCIPLPDQGDFVENVLQAATAAPEHRYLLYATVDIPLLTAAAVRDFVSRGLESGADLCYPIIPLELCRQRFPHMPRTALSLREGTFTGGNLLLVRAGVVRRQAALLRRAFRARKSVWGMAQILGAGIILRVVLARLVSPRLLSVEHIKARVQQLMGATAQEIITPYAEIGVDVDRVEHLKGLQEAGYRVGRTS